MHTQTIRRLSQIFSLTLALILILSPGSIEAASSWSPTLLVNTEAFQTIDAGDGSSNMELLFGTSSKTLKFLFTQQRFQFSHSLNVIGNISGTTLNINGAASVNSLTATGAIRTKGTFSGATLRIGSGGADVQGLLNASGAVRTDSDLTINDDAGAVDAVFTFGNATANQTLKFLNTTQKFQFTKSLSILGTLSGSSLNVDGNATVGGSLTATGAIRTKGTFSGATLRIGSGGADVQGLLNASGAVRTDSDLTINDDAGAVDAVFTFGNATANQTLKFLNTTQKFQFTKSLSILGTLSGSSLNVDGNATVGGSLTATGAIRTKGTFSGATLRIGSGGADVQGLLNASGAVRTDSDLTINDDAGAVDAVFTFGNATANQTLKFLNTKQKFQFTKSLSILGTLSGSSLNVDGNATVGGSLTATGSIRTKGNLSGATLTVDGNMTLHGITYSAPVSQGAANTFLKNDGAGNLTWGSAAVGNGSGNLLSLHPEYPNSIYFSSGSSLVGQLSASGSSALNENFYHWTTTRATLQDYWISIRVRVPDNFSSWDPVKPVEIRYKTSDGVAANNYIKVLMKDTNNAYLAALTGSMLSPSFKTSNLRGPETSGTFAAKGYFTLYIKLASLTGKFAEVGFVNFNFETTTP